MDLLLIYQMGKVGSTTIYNTLKSNVNDMDIFQIHYLNEETVKKKIELLNSYDPPLKNSYFQKNLEIIETIKNNHYNKIKIITVTRELIGRKVSAIFESLYLFPHLIDNKLLNINELYKIINNFFLEKKVDEFFREEIGWFDDELKKFYGIDVFSYPFDFEKKYTIIKNDDFEVLVIRQEDINKIFKNAIKEFLEIQDIELVNSNEADSKWYKEIYNFIKNNLDIPISLCEDIYNLKYHKHFYLKSEIDSYIEKWGSNSLTNDTDKLNLRISNFKKTQLQLLNEFQKKNIIIVELKTKIKELTKTNKQLRTIHNNYNYFDIIKLRYENQQLKNKLYIANGWINYVQGLTAYKIFKFLKGTLKKILDRNVDNNDNLPTIFHITHWKAGSQWIAALFENLAPNRIIKPMLQNEQFFVPQIEQGNIYVTLYLPKKDFDSVVIPEDHRKFFIMRDLRDTLVSYYFSMKYSHGINNDYVVNLREKLSDTEIENGLLLLFEPLQAMAEIQLSWINSDILIIKYEEIIENEIEQLMKIVEFCEINESKERILTAIKKSSFKSKSNGRNLGDVDIKSHTRQGLPGDWKNHFTPKLKELFKERFGEVLIMTGYEKNNNW